MNFDLDINNYTKEELIDMFELPPNYDKNILDMKELKLRDSVINNKEITKDTQLNTIQFLVKAKNIILNEREPSKPKKQYNPHLPKNATELESNDDHMVQIKPKRDNSGELYSGIINVTSGGINPLKKTILTQYVSIDSRFRNNYYSTTASNFNFNLVNKYKNVVQLLLNNIELPTTYYLISKKYGNNFFYITVDHKTHIIIIPDGNYDQYSIMTSINNSLSKLGKPFQDVEFIINASNSGNTTPYGGTIVTGTSQTIVGYSYKKTGDAPHQTIELNFQTDIEGLPDENTPLPLKLGWILGFRNGIYKNNLNYVSEGAVDVGGIKYIFLVVDDYNNNVNQMFTSVFNASFLNKAILARITTYNGNILSTTREYFGPVDIQSMTVQLLDEYGRIIDLNNMDFSFCLTINIAYSL
jgi:hypothetical protein